MTAVVIDEEVATVLGSALAQFVTVARTLLGKEPTAMSHVHRRWRYRASTNARLV